MKILKVIAKANGKMFTLIVDEPEGSLLMIVEPQVVVFILINTLFCQYLVLYIDNSLNKSVAK